MGRDLSTYGNSVSRGIRNNNPGNIRSSSTKWQGQVGTDSAGFVIFKDISYGIRAFGKDIKSKIGRGIDTLDKIIFIYAPPSENNTVAYVSAVSKDTGITPTQKLTADSTTLKALARGFFNHENGKDANLITANDIAEGIALVFTGGGALPLGSGSSLIILIILITVTFLILTYGK